MKAQIYYWFLIFVFPILAFSHDQGLPLSWYQLPEDSDGRRESDSEEKEKEKKAAIGIETLLHSTSTALDGVTEVQEKTGQRRGDDWGFRALYLDLSLSGSGLVGAMMAKGDASAKIYWRPKGHSGEDRLAPQNEQADLMIQGNWSRKEVANQLEPVIRAAMATKEIKDEPVFRKNVLELVLGYQHLIQHIAFDPGREWYLSKLRLDFTVDVSGNVQPAVTVGGGVRLRFEWEPSTTRLPFHYRSRVAENLERFLKTIGNDLQGLPFEALSPSAGMSLDRLKFGLGIFGDGKFGVAKVGASVMGFMYLSRRTLFIPIQDPPNQLEASIPLIDSEPVDGHLEYARASGIRYIEETIRGQRRVIYQIPREAFRKGLQKSAKIGAFFAERAEKSHGSRWELYQIKTEFALSLSGSTGLITLGGKAALQLRFVKKHHDPQNLVHWTK